MYSFSHNLKPFESSMRKEFLGVEELNHVKTILQSQIKNITKMASLLVDLESPVPYIILFKKIICSILPSYNGIVAIWSNVANKE